MSEVVGVVPPGRDPGEYDRLRRRVLWLLPTGLYVLGTKSGTERNLMTVSWVTQVALAPKSIGVAVERTAVTHRLLLEGQVFALSLLPRSERSIVRKFVKPVEEADVDDETGEETMRGFAVRAHSTGAPVLELSAAWIDCELRHVLEIGSHSLFVGEVVDCGSGALEKGGPGAKAAGPEGAEVPEAPEELEILRMQDTRMSYGG